MTCDCISKSEIALADHKLEVAVIWRRGANDMELQTFTPLIRRDTGRREGRSSQPRMAAHTFCPFCGTAYAAEARSMPTSQATTGFRDLSEPSKIDAAEAINQ